MTNRRHRDAIRLARMADTFWSAVTWPLVAAVFAADRHAPGLFAAGRGVLAAVARRCAL